MDKLLIGSHVSISKPGYLLHALDEAIEADENCFMFYTGAPQNTIRQPLTSMNLEEFKIQIHKNNVDIDNVVVHAPYIINIASSDIEKKKFAISFLSSEIRRVSEIGCKLIVVHPGNATNGISVGEAIKNCADVVNEINKVNKNVVICLETMAGKGNEIGKTFEELNSIIQLIHNKSLIGVCIDTCHTWDYGYNWNEPKSVLDEFDKVVGLSYLKCFHINDSLNECGAKKDRHANIGYGMIGFDNIISICYNDRVSNLPKILETPLSEKCNVHKMEVKMIRDKKFIDWNK